MNLPFPTAPEYYFPLPFEENFDIDGARRFKDRHYEKCLYVSAGYLVLVFLGQKFMKYRKPYDLKWALFIWNIALAIMSIGGTLRTLPELVHVVRHFGIRYSICNPGASHESPINVCWVFIFSISKLFEFIDTVFVVLRKKKLIFLHWFHHSSVLVLTWIVAGDEVPVGRWFMSMNYAVHSVMYTYFALRTLGFRIPEKISLSITSLQILQMLFGFYISILTFVMWYNQEPECVINARCAFLAISLYSFYFYLFIHYFRKAYLAPGGLKLE